MKKNQENIPEKALIGFLECWKKRNFKKMVEFTQITWQSDKGEDAKKFLKDFYGIKKLIFFEIKDRITTQEIFVDIWVIIKYRLLNSEIRKKRITARIICETGAYQPNKDGTWGVNPIGALKEA